MQIVTECYASTTVNLATVLRLFSRMCSLESLEMRASSGDDVKHGVLAWSVADGPKAYQGLDNRS